MNILITGGTGAVGARLAMVLARHNRVFIPTRKNIENIRADTRTKDNNIFYVQKDLLKDDADLRGIDIVYHLAANTNETDPDMYKQNIALTRNVVEMAKKAGVKHIILLSSSGVLGETDEPSKEDMEYNPFTKYEESKMISEQLVKESSIPYTIIRASIIMMPNNIWRAIIGAAMKGFPLIGSGENKFHLSYINDVIALLALVKDRQKAKNQTYHIAAKDSPTYFEVYKMICSELRIPMTEKRISPALLKFLLLFKNDPVINRHTVDRLLRNRQLSTEKTKQELGYEPRFTTQQALAETIKGLKLMKLGYSEHDVAEISMMK
ncbi:MAG: NAD-dependent epimerase/dehydratase family protein [Candidatus Aenigmarchaeota archaeon]|nr:NAD-dependent epimerase/dehydratase family protein [Candidatus Aenigmarchaeota archaeon]